MFRHIDETGSPFVTFCAPQPSWAFTRVERGILIQDDKFFPAGGITLDEPTFLGFMTVVSLATEPGDFDGQYGPMTVTTDVHGLTTVTGDGNVLVFYPAESVAMILGVREYQPRGIEAILAEITELTKLDASVTEQVAAAVVTA